jgi:hypothetical protein
LQSFLQFCTKYKLERFLYFSPRLSLYNIGKAEFGIYMVFIIDLTHINIYFPRLTEWNEAQNEYYYHD